MAPSRGKGAKNLWLFPSDWAADQHLGQSIDALLPWSLNEVKVMNELIGWRFEVTSTDKHISYFNIGFMYMYKIDTRRVENRAVSKVVVLWTRPRTLKAPPLNRSSPTLVQCQLLLLDLITEVGPRPRGARPGPSWPCYRETPAPAYLGFACY